MTECRRREDAHRGTVDVVVLTALERPQKGDQPGQAEHQRHRHQVDQDVHEPNPGRSRARNAFTVTRSEEPDMASAAISGVTRPAIAIGTANKL